jgi:hypothetical protein
MNRPPEAAVNFNMLARERALFEPCDAEICEAVLARTGARASRE